MARGGPPDDDLGVVVRRGLPSGRRSCAMAIALLTVALAAAGPGSRPATDETRLEVSSGPTSTLAQVLHPADMRPGIQGDVTTSASALMSSATPRALAILTAEVLAPIQALSSSEGGVPVRSSGDPTTSPTAGTAKPPSTTTARPTTTTTTTTAKPTTTTTTRPTTTTQPPPCTWSGQVQTTRTGFVFDGQSNVLSPDWQTGFAVKLMETRFPGNPYKLTAVRGTSYVERSGWAPERVDIYADRAPCTLLVSHGGESDLIRGGTALELAQRVRDYVAARRAAGFDVIVVPTIPPATYYDESADAQRVIYNDLLRRNFRSGGIDVLVDLDALPQLRDPTDARWFSDGAHYTDEGSTLVAETYSRALP